MNNQQNQDQVEETQAESFAECENCRIRIPVREDRYLYQAQLCQSCDISLGREVAKCEICDKQIEYFPGMLLRDIKFTEGQDARILCETHTGQNTSEPEYPRPNTPEENTQNIVDLTPLIDPDSRGRYVYDLDEFIEFLEEACIHSVARSVTAYLTSNEESDQ